MSHIAMVSFVINQKHILIKDSDVIWRLLAANTCQILNVRVTEEVVDSGDYLRMIHSYDLTECLHPMDIEVV